MALPLGLQAYWPPHLRAIPLFLWQLAEAVPYPTGAPPSQPPSSTATDADGGCACPTRPHPTTVCGAPTSGETAVGQPTPTSSSPVVAVPTTMTGATGAGVGDVESETTVEVACFTAIAQHVANTLYGHPPQSSPPHRPSSPAPPDRFSPSPPPSATTTQSAEETGAATSQSVTHDAVRYGLLPCVKSQRRFLPPASLLTDGTVRAVVSVEALYKVFERC